MRRIDQLAALSDPTRRAIFESLVIVGPRAVGELAETMDVSRPAVSQHLKVLRGAGFVSVSAEGTRRVYAADPAGVVVLQRWVDSLWATLLDRFVEAAQRQEKRMLPSNTPASVTKRRTVALDPDRAFELFTARIAEWWPTDSHSIHGADVVDVTFDGRIGGQILEHARDGSRCSWGEVLAWDPPNRFVLSWHPHPEPRAASRLEVRFVPSGQGTEIILEHTGWEEFGSEGATIREQYDQGWDIVLEPFESLVALAVAQVE